MVTGSGCFGKIPSHGDFVSRSLPRDFTTAWDDWLQAGLAESRDILGDDWLDIYLTSPIWKFALASGLVGNVAAVGLFIPSVDRVGRYFPFTLAALIENAPSPYALREETGDWFERAEPLALSVLQEDFSFDDLLSDLEELTIPSVVSERASSKGALRFSEENGAGLASHLALTSTAPYGLFWTSGSEDVAPTSLFSQAMPSPRQFTALLDGAFQDHGWGEAST